MSEQRKLSFKDWRFSDAGRKATDEALARAKDMDHYTVNLMEAAWNAAALAASGTCEHGRTEPHEHPIGGVVPYSCLGPGSEPTRVTDEMVNTAYDAFSFDIQRQTADNKQRDGWGHASQPKAMRAALEALFRAPSEAKPLSIRSCGCPSNPDGTCGFCGDTPCECHK